MPAWAAPQQPAVAPVPVSVPAAEAVPAGTERVGRGLVFSLGGIVVGVVLTVVLWQLNFFASITSFAMAYSAIWLYTLGAGRQPARGASGVIGVILLGVGACLAALVAADTLTAIARDFPEASMSQRVQFIVENLLSPEVWSAYTREVLMSVLFAALGTFGLIRQLGRARRA